MIKILSVFLIILMAFSCISCGNFVKNKESEELDITDESSDFSTDGTSKFTDITELEKITESTEKPIENPTENPTENPDFQEPPHVHQYSSTVVEATLEAEGYTEHKCECGDSYKSDFTPKKVEISLIFDGKANAEIVLPTSANRYTLYARDRLQLSAQNMTGAALLEESEAAFEILIGDTDRAESAELKATLAENEYAIKLYSDKLVIVAKNDVFLYEATRYFIDNYLKEPYARVDAEAKEITLLTDSIEIKRSGDKDSLYYKLSLTTKPTGVGVAVHTLDNQKYGVTNAEPRIYRRQGGCYTGDYYFQVFITKKEELAVIGKKNIKTGEITYSEPRNMEHANDATYDPYNNRLIVGSGKTVWIYNADTLEFIESMTFTHTTSKFSYSPERHTYVLGSYYFYDDSLTYTKQYFKGALSSLGVDSSGMSAQGSCCDDTFIYSLVIDSIDGVYNAYISVYDWYGNIIAFATIEIPGDFEAENISIVDGKLYIAACSTQPVATLYEVVLY